MFMLLKNLSNVALLKGAHKHNSTNRCLSAGIYFFQSSVTLTLAPVDLS